MAIDDCLLPIKPRDQRTLLSPPSMKPKFVIESPHAKQKSLRKHFSIQIQLIEDGEVLLTFPRPVGDVMFIERAARYSFALRRSETELRTNRKHCAPLERGSWSR